MSFVCKILMLGMTEEMIPSSRLASATLIHLERLGYGDR
jgi:hypothetical protein